MAVEQCFGNHGEIYRYLPTYIGIEDGLNGKQGLHRCGFFPKDSEISCSKELEP